MKTDVYNFEGVKTGTVEMPDSLFGVAWKPALVQQVVTAQLANRRRPWAHAKDRSEVRGGGRKPWRQKGTGRARHGSIRSPLWIGGGKAHGPHNERDFTEKVNKKMRQVALASVLSQKLRDGEVRVMESLALTTPKTKEIAKRLSVFLALPKYAKKYDTLLVPQPGNSALARAARNLVKTKVISPTSLNVYDVLNYKRLLVDRAALEVMQKHYAIKA
jgi:large subunit ribosomal protein L4